MVGSRLCVTLLIALCFVWNTQFTFASDDDCRHQITKLERELLLSQNAERHQLNRATDIQKRQAQEIEECNNIVAGLKQKIIEQEEIIRQHSELLKSFAGASRADFDPSRLTTVPNADSKVDAACIVPENSLYKQTSLMEATPLLQTFTQLEVEASTDSTQLNSNRQISKRSTKIHG